MFFRRFASIYAFDFDSFFLTWMDIFLLDDVPESRPSACLSTAYICGVGGRVHGHTSRSLHGNGVPPAITTRQPTLQNSKIVAPLSPINLAQKKLFTSKWKTSLHKLRPTTSNATANTKADPSTRPFYKMQTWVGRINHVSLRWRLSGWYFSA